MRTDKTRQREARRLRRERGICLDCESPNLTKTAAGERSRYCKECLPMHSTAMAKVRHGALQTPRPLPELTDYRDGKKFITYRKEIAALFERHRALTIPEIHRLVGEPIREWTMDALEMLDLIEHGALPVRYELFTPKRYDNARIGNR